MRLWGRMPGVRAPNVRLQMTCFLRPMMQQQHAWDALAILCLIWCLLSQHPCRKLCWKLLSTVLVMCLQAFALMSRELGCNGSEWWPAFFFLRKHHDVTLKLTFDLLDMKCHHFIILSYILIIWEVRVTFDLQSQISSYSSERLDKIWRQYLKVLRYCVTGMGCMYIRGHTKCRHSGCLSIWTNDLKTCCLLCSTQISSKNVTLLLLVVLQWAETTKKQLTTEVSNGKEKSPSLPALCPMLGKWVSLPWCSWQCRLWRGRWGEGD